MSNFCLGKRAGISPYEHNIKTVSPTGKRAGSPPYEQALIVGFGAGWLSNSLLDWTTNLRVIDSLSHHPVNPAT